MSLSNPMIGAFGLPSIFRQLALVAAATFFSSELASAQQAENLDDKPNVYAGLEEVIVTARRRAEGIQSVPIPISALSEDYLEKRGVEDLTDLSRLVPNFSLVNATNNNSTAVVFLRGIGQVNWQPVQDPKVGIYLDGVYLARPQGSVFDVVDISQIEVLRGPQGTLFGRNTTAGLVHVITNKPVLGKIGKTEGQVKVGFGNQGQANVSAVANVPVVEESLAIRVSYQLSVADGYVRNRSTNQDWNNENSQILRISALWQPADGLQMQFKADWQKVDEHPRLGSCTWTGPTKAALDALQAGAVAGAVAVAKAALPSTATQADIDAATAAATTAGLAAPIAGPTLVPGSLLPGLGQLAYIYNVYGEIEQACNDTSPYASDDKVRPGNDKSTVNAGGLNLTIDGDIGFATLTSISAYRTSKAFNGAWGFGTDKRATPSYLEILGVHDDKYDQWSEEIRLAGATDKLDWVVGAYFFEENGLNDLDVFSFRGITDPDPATWPLWGAAAPAAVQAVFAAAGVTTWGDYATTLKAGANRTQIVDANNSSNAVFGEVTWRIIEKLSLTAGARYTEDKRKFTRTHQLNVNGLGTLINDPTLLTCPDGNAPIDGKICSVSANFNEITPRAILSYKTDDDLLFYGGWSRGYSSGGFNQDRSMVQYEPEVSDNLEAGMKSAWLNKGLVLNLTGFYNMYKNQQLIVGRLVNGAPTAAVLNAKEAELWGLEGELRWLIMEGLALTASVGWLDGKYKDFTVNDTTIDPATGETVQTPQNYTDNEIVRASPLTMTAALSYNWEIPNGSLLVANVGWSYRGRSYNTLDTLDTSRQSPFSLVDARIVWNNKDERLSVAIWGRNILDEEYFTGALDFSGGNVPSYSNTLYWAEKRRLGVEISVRFGG